MVEETQKPQDDRELLYKALGVMLPIKDRFNETFQKTDASKEDIAELKALIQQ